MTHDAEIAVTLMNRWQRSGGESDNRTSHLQLLREGGLSFEATRAGFKNAAAEWSRVEVECLTFTDGSRALRLVHAEPTRLLTSWSAVWPLRPVSSCRSVSVCDGQVNND
ncbi:hypothetical protein [Paraburkholderia caledonica]|jgi:hypothetical protein|uniref:hypothetical protein n=1 Tax=Paraburkholderia caledonica TaxID=134536 RepID=UPI0005A72306|nr:hypothetical protein [Paraburkholderia caledonica]